MTPDRLIPLVAQMRDAQRQYFRDRSIVALNESKRLEREVDRAIEVLRRPPTDPSQDELFPA